MISGLVLLCHSEDELSRSQALPIPVNGPGAAAAMCLFCFVDMPVNFYYAASNAVCCFV